MRCHPGFSILEVRRTLVRVQHFLQGHEDDDSHVPHAPPPPTHTLTPHTGYYFSTSAQTVQDKVRKTF